MKLLLAEDERELSRAVCTVLGHFGYETDAAYDGEEAAALATGNSYDCILLDIMMPKKDGITVLQEIRQSGNVTPVILLTAKSQVEDRVDGLDAGADDYLTKPFAVKELVARVNSLLRRAGAYTPTKLTMGNVQLNTEEQELSAVNSVRLSRKEAQLMQLLLLNQGKSFTTQELYERVWHDEPEGSLDLVWVYISYLRKKLSAIAADLQIEGEKDGSFRLRTGSGDGTEKG